MKKILFISISLLLFHYSNSQAYFPFPNETAEWHNLTWAQWSPNDIFLTNSKYLLQGDTTLMGQAYHKVYYNQSDYNSDLSYIGGLREDLTRNIYFFPASSTIPSWGGIFFPSDTSEVLLYTFNNLQPGTILPINQGNRTVEVISVDSILLGNSYRKRYQIQQSNLLGNDYWIEGIGSTKDLFSPYTWEFEWSLFTLCFTDTATYYIHSPNGADSCHYYLPLGIPEETTRKLSLSPNPSTDKIKVGIAGDFLPASIYLVNQLGQLIREEDFVVSPTELDISGLNPGTYFVICNSCGKRTIEKFIKN